LLRVWVVERLGPEDGIRSSGDTGAGFFATRKLLPDYEALMARSTLTGKLGYSPSHPPRTSTFDTLFLAG